MPQSPKPFGVAELSKLLRLPSLATQLQRVEQEMARLLKTDSPALQKPLGRLLQGGGKRLRPALVIASAASQGKTIDQPVIKAAAAVELIHLSSLVHDDIIDDAASRWNRPTISHQEGVPTAILVGDFMFARAVEAAASINAEVAATVSKAFAVMTVGQSLELHDTHRQSRTPADYLQTIEQKTAALMAASCRLGGLCAGAQPTSLQALTNYGESFGMAFQLLDDLRDLLVAPASGKPVGNDIREGVYTLPVLLALKGKQQAIVKGWLATPDKLQATEITEVLVANGALTKTVELVREYNAAADQAVRSLGNQPVMAGLARLPNAYQVWALQNTVAAFL